MINIINALKSLEPKVVAAVSVAPLAIGVCIGYIMHGPIKLALDAINLLMKL
jgi:hypothetical protein